MKKKKKSINIQIFDLIQQMAASEPSLFDNKEENLMPVSIKEIRTEN